VKQPTIRRMQPGDLEAVAAMFDRLSPRTRVRRFFSPTESGPTWELNYLAGANRDWVRVAEIADDAAGWGRRIVGIARFHRISADHAEVAIVVEDEWQRHGLGRRLMAHLAGAARAEGITVFDLSILGENDAALGLLHRTARHKPTLHLSAGVFEGTVPLVA
jgi:GNAT superfamily N-acetyltransferase